MEEEREGDIRKIFLGRGVYFGEFDFVNTKKDFFEVIFTENYSPFVHVYQTDQFWTGKRKKVWKKTIFFKIEERYAEDKLKRQIIDAFECAMGPEAEDCKEEACRIFEFCLKNEEFKERFLRANRICGDTGGLSGGCYQKRCTEPCW